jgi:hypothetical protein
MREAALIKRLLVTASSAAMFIFIAGCSVEANGDSAAHDLAEVFAKEAARTDAQPQKAARDDKRKTAEGSRKATEAQRKAEEAEMLTRAREEAEQRRQEIVKAREEAERAELARKADEERWLAEARRKAEEEAKAEETRRQAEAARKAEEERRVAEARRAEEQARAAEEALKLAEARRKAEEEAKAEEARRQAEVARKAEEERRVAEARRAEEQARAEEARRQAELVRRAEEERRLAEARKAEEQAKAAEEARKLAAEEAQRSRLAAERDAEGQRLADVLRAARQERDLRTVDKVTSGQSLRPLQSDQGSAEPARAVEPVMGTQAPQSWTRARPESDGRVTVLLLLQPGNYGIRRGNKQADPILCSYEGCYVSNGADQPASFLPGRRAFGFGRVFGERAGACSNSLGCVFRGIDLKSIATSLMPVDLHVIKHDRRQPQENVSVSDCRLERAQITCRRSIRAADYVMWIIPEGLANRAGPEVLESALDEGLPDRERVGLYDSPLR